MDKAFTAEHAAAIDGAQNRRQHLAELTAEYRAQVERQNGQVYSTSHLWDAMEGLRSDWGMDGEEVLEAAEALLTDRKALESALVEIYLITLQLTVQSRIAAAEPGTLISNCVFETLGEERLNELLDTIPVDKKQGLAEGIRNPQMIKREITEGDV